MIVTAADSPKVFTLDAVDKPYRLSRRADAAGGGDADGRRRDFCSAISGSRSCSGTCSRSSSRAARSKDFVEPGDRPLIDALLHDGLVAGVQGEVSIRGGDGPGVPVFLGVSALHEGAAGNAPESSPTSPSRSCGTG